MTTKKTATVSCRLPTATVIKIQYYAKLKGATVSDWLKPIILRALSAGKTVHKKEAPFTQPSTTGQATQVDLPPGTITYNKD
jgi:hypothetical protein